MHLDCDSIVKGSRLRSSQVFTETQKTWSKADVFKFLKSGALLAIDPNVVLQTTEVFEVISTFKSKCRAVRICQVESNAVLSDYEKMTGYLKDYYSKYFSKGYEVREIEFEYHQDEQRIYCTVRQIKDSYPVIEISARYPDEQDINFRGAQILLEKFTFGKLGILLEDLL